mgnify:CR=1 FL=1
MREKKKKKKKKTKQKKKKKTYPTGNGMAAEPENSPGPMIFKSDPNTILHSLRNDTVQNGRTKS